MTERRYVIDRTGLSAHMDFDRVIVVHDDGTVSDSDRYAPEVYAEDDGTTFLSAGWELLNGYSGQYGYSGPVMHSSEFIGGRMADDILSEPGEYVALVVYGLGDQAEDSDDDAPHGWAVARWIGE